MSSSIHEFSEAITAQHDKDGFQLLPSDFEFPVDFAFGYTYDDEMKRIYVAGGYKGFEKQDKFYEIQLIPDSSCVYPYITRTSELPHQRGMQGCVCVKLSNKIYVIGGKYDDKTRLDTMYSFDLSTGLWQEEASMNTARSYPSAVVLTKKRGNSSSRSSNTLMVCGGCDNAGNDLDTCEVYDDATKRWTIQPYRLNEARNGPISVCSGGNLVVVAGGESSSTSTRLVTTEMIDLDSVNPQWKFGPMLTEKRDAAAASMVGDYVVVAGGYTGDKSLQSCEAIAIGDLFAYNDNASGRQRKQWQLLRGFEMEKGRSWFGLALVGNHLMALSGYGSDKTCETMDVSWVLERTASRQPSRFYQLLLRQDHRYTMSYRLEELANAVGDVHETKILYTYVKQCIRQGLIDSSSGNTILKAGLAKSAETCTSEDAFVMCVLILEKAKEDLIITQQDYIRFKNRAEVKRLEHVPFIKEMKAAIEINTQRIDGLERSVDGLRIEVSKLFQYMENVKESISRLQQNIDQVNNSVQRLKHVLTQQRRIEASISFITSVVNAVTMGVGGSLVQAFEKILTGVVDFGDPAHILEVINIHTAKQPESEELGDAYMAIKDSFELGAQLALGGAEEVLADAIQEGNAPFALAAIATLAYEEFRDAQDDIDAINGTDTTKYEAATATPSLGGSAIPDTFRDAILSVEDENSLPLHAAVKFADMDMLNETCLEGNAFINELDSEGRTALDLAALTGQPDMVQELLSRGGEFKVGSAARMRRVTRIRSSKHQEYMEYIDSMV